MAAFYSLLSFININSFESSDPGSFDILTCLPLEIAIIILRKLPGKDLLNGACVSKKWFSICKSDEMLRKKIRRYIRHQKKAMITNRLFGTNSRIGPSNISTRPPMTNVFNYNTGNSLYNRVIVEPSSYRYLPYQRELSANIGVTRPSTLRRGPKNVEVIKTARSRLRM